MMNILAKILVAVLAAGYCYAQSTIYASCARVTNISYYDAAALRDADDYQRSQCRLDLRYPTNKSRFATVVWFHGGGLTTGKRSVIDLKTPDIAVVGVGYRLSPKVSYPAFIEDAAAAIAWVIKNIGSYGGDPGRVYLSGHSAGGYLILMTGMDPKWLAVHAISNTQIAGLIPVSAQVTTHFLVKKQRGDTGPQYRPIIDECAPLYYCAKDLPPVCIITGDRAIEFKCRVEENELMYASLKALGHPAVEFHEMKGFNHSTIATGGLPSVRAFVEAMETQPRKTVANPAGSTAPDNTQNE
ncbi:MAG: alpha/beta hydrolase [Spirochaetes bacterium]|nr:alpha/beta hydrolase [Spirochaetota bacterium]